MKNEPKPQLSFPESCEQKACPSLSVRLGDRRAKVSPFQIAAILKVFILGMSHSVGLILLLTCQTIHYVELIGCEPIAYHFSWEHALGYFT